jgi:membrane protease YdiL (CAAX protease family)
MNGNAASITPMSLPLAVLFFGIPSALTTVAIYVLWPALLTAGLSGVWAMTVCVGGPLLLLLVAALVAFRLEGNALSFAALATRFRLRRMVDRDWLWGLGLFVVFLASFAALRGTATWLASFPAFAPPDHLPALLDPRVPKNTVPTDFLGVPLQGTWWIVVVYLLNLAVNVFGEEFWWRGYILPRQELVHGKRTWVFHGLLWTLFHVFWKWNLLVLLPGCLALSYVVQRTRNTTLGIIVHFAVNAMVMIPLVAGVLGVSR